MSKLAEPALSRTFEHSLRPLILSLAGLAFLALRPLEFRCEPLTLASLGLAGLVIAPLTVKLPGQRWPISLLPLVLVPTWLLCGDWPTAVLAIVGQLFATLFNREARLRPAWQAAAGLAGVGAGGLLGSAISAPLPPGLLLNLARAAVFAVGLWAGQAVAEWLHARRIEAPPGWLVGLLTSLLLVPPGVFLAHIGSGPDWLPFVASLGLAVGLLVLVRASTNSETGRFELAAEVAGSADARNHLELIVDQAPEAIFGMDAQGRVRWLNRTAAGWLGERAESAVGQPASAAVPVLAAGGGRLDHAELMAQAARDGRPLHEEGLLEGAPGAPQRVLASYSAAVDPSSGDLGLVLLRDASVMTESLREQEDLAVHLSHELRAPLTTILGYAQMMANPGSYNIVPTVQAEFAKRIGESGDYMLRLVNNLLDLGRLDRDGAESLPLTQVEVASLTRAVVDSNRQPATAKALELVYEEPSEAIQVESADLALRQVLTNVIGNAIKYTPPNGKVTVTLSASPARLTWQVSDTGIGLSPDEQGKVFTRFFRSRRPEARLIKGTGLGLALTKALLERLGGTIRVQSAVDRGSTFTIEIPR